MSRGSRIAKSQDQSNTQPTMPKRTYSIPPAFSIQDEQAQSTPPSQPKRARLSKPKSFVSLPTVLLHSIFEYACIDDFEFLLKIADVDRRLLSNSDSWWATGGVRYRVQTVAVLGTESIEIGTETKHLVVPDGMEPPKPGAGRTVFVNADDIELRDLWRLWSYQRAMSEPNRFVIHIRKFMWSGIQPDDISRRQTLLEDQGANIDRIVLLGGDPFSVVREQRARYTEQFTLDVHGIYIGGTHYHSISMHGVMREDEWWNGVEPGSRCTRQDMEVMYHIAGGDSDEADSAQEQDASSSSDSEEEDFRFLGASFASNRLISSFGNSPPPAHPYALLGSANQHLRGPNGRYICPLSWRFSVQPVFFSPRNYSHDRPHDHRLQLSLFDRFISGRNEVTTLDLHMYRMMPNGEPDGPVGTSTWDTNPIDYEDVPDYDLAVTSDGLRVSVHYGIERSYVSGEESFTLDPLELIPFHDRTKFLEFKKRGTFAQDDLIIPTIVQDPEDSYTIRFAGVKLSKGMMNDGDTPVIGLEASCNFVAANSLGQDHLYI